MAENVDIVTNFNLFSLLAPNHRTQILEPDYSALKMLPFRACSPIGAIFNFEVWRLALGCIAWQKHKHIAKIEFQIG